MFSGPVACDFDSDDHCVVVEPVEEGRRDDGIAEDVAPFREASVRGGDHRAFFATRICDLEEQARAALRDGQATDFIDDEQRGPREEADFFGEPALPFGFCEAVGGFGERGFVDTLSGFDGGDAECGREVGLSCAGRSEEVGGFASPDEVELGQGGDSLAVERGQECEVEAFNRLDGEELRGSQCDVDSSCFAQGAIFAQECVDGFDGCGLALLEAPQRGSERFERPGHFQADQGGTDAVDEFGRRVAPCRSRRRPTASWKAKDCFGASSRLGKSIRGGGGLRWTGASRLRLLEPYEGYLAEKIGNSPDLSGRRLFRQIQERGYEGSQAAVTAHLRAIRPDEAPKFKRRFETRPGEQSQADFAEFKTGFADEPGVVRKVHLFPFVVGEGVDAEVQLHEVLAVELPAAVELVSPRPFCALNASVELGLLRGQIQRSMLWPRTRFRRRSGPSSPWTECPQEPCPRARVRSSRSRSGMLESRSTSPRDLRLRTSRASSRTASPERLPLPSVKERAVRPDHANGATAESRPGSALYPHLVNTSA